MAAYIKNTITEITVNGFSTNDGKLIVYVTAQDGKSFYLPAEQIIIWR